MTHLLQTNIGSSRRAEHGAPERPSRGRVRPGLGGAARRPVLAGTTDPSSGTRRPLRRWSIAELLIAASAKAASRPEA